MENILHQRLKNIIVIVFVGIALASYFIFFIPPALDKDKIDKFILERINIIEKKLDQQNRDYQERAEQVFHRYRSKNLPHPQLNPREALIVEENGAIKEYFGEIYHFTLLPLETGVWAFIEKNKNIYFVLKMADHVFYVRFFCHLENNRLLTSTSFALSEIKYSQIPLLALENKYIYDNMNDLISYYHLLKHSNDQFFLHLKFAREDIEHYYKKKKKIFFCSVMGLFLLIGIFYFYKEKLILSQLFWLAFLVDLFFFITLVTTGHNNLYLTLNLLKITVEFHSLYQVLIILLFILSGLYFLRGRFKNKIVFYLLFNAALVIAVTASDSMFKGIQFNYVELTWNHFLLIIVTFLLHVIPLFFIIEAAPQLNAGLKNHKQKATAVVIFLLIQTLLILLFYAKFKMPLGNLILLSLIAFILLFSRRGLLVHAVLIFLLAVSIYHLTGGYSLKEKKEFIENNLKNIFLNQGNYAKFIALEIVHEINLNRRDFSDFYEFFEGNTSSKLENIWRRTIASRENIASGIFVVSEDDQVLSRFAYQIPFFKVRLSNIFPIWAMEDTTAEIHGREIPLAAAYISIFKEWDYLGRIVVLVYNSPGLLLRYQEKVNIFTIDNKINGKDFSFIKLNADNQITENPSNINLENISGILTHNNQWIKFKAMEMTFKGYIFRHSGNTVIIFFPASTLFKNFSGVIKIFLMLSLLVLLFYVKRVKEIEWRSIYYSFSIRVFAILILISVLTAIVFSIFFINFISRTSEQKVMRMVYEGGRTAQNIAYDMIKDKKDFSRDYLFSISNILSADVSIYEEDGGLVETSNYRKLINSQIPDYLHSQILTLLNKKNQKFVLFEDEENFRLCYKIYDYIFMSEFSNKWEKVLYEERYYTDFIITMFFILIIIGFSTAFFFRNKILSPIDGLNKGMAEVERGKLPKLERIPAETEIKSLYMGFNSMIEGIREQQRAISEMSRMKTIIRLGRRVAHEVKNPLTPIKLSAEQILKALKDKNPNYEEIIKQSVNYIIDETEHLKKVSYGFLDLSRLDEISAEEFDLVDLVREELFNVTQIYSHIEFVFYIDAREEEPEVKTIMVTLDKIKIKQVLKNLLTNSIEALGERKGEIRINLKKDRHDRRVILEVADNGIGMDEIEFERAFEVDYSTKEIGTGLGLFIVKRIIELHHGHIEIHSRKHKGTRVILDLPEKV
jgi:signal transduction histidine kinase